MRSYNRVPEYFVVIHSHSHTNVQASFWADLLSGDFVWYRIPVAWVSILLWNVVLIKFSWEMAEEIGDVAAQQQQIVDDPEDAPGYQAPPQKTIAEILQADEDDESLRKYKAALLGTDAEPIIVGE